MSSAAEKETQDRTPDEPRPRKMLNEQDVLRLSPISSVSLWRLEKSGRFPKGTFVSPNRKFWYADEVAKWQDEINGRGRGRKNHRTDSKS